MRKRDFGPFWFRRLGRQCNPLISCPHSRRAPPAARRGYPANPIRPLENVLPKFRLRAFAPLALMACLTSAELAAQVGPLQAIMLPNAKQSTTLQNIPDFNEDFLVPVDVTVGPDGSVTDVVVSTSSGDPKVDNVAVAFMKEKKFLPGLDPSGIPTESRIAATVDIRSKTRHKQLSANLKPPNSSTESARVLKLRCSDFLWEIERLRTQAASADLSREIMPFVSARLYQTNKQIGRDDAGFWEKWPKALEQAEKRCVDSPDKAYYGDVLVPTLDAALGGR